MLKSQSLIILTLLGMASISMAAPTPSEVEAKVISVVSHQLDIHSEKPITQSRIQDLGGDEFDIIDIAQRLEKEYSISMTDNELDSVSRVDDFTQIVVKKVKQ